MNEKKITIDYLLKMLAKEQQKPKCKMQHTLVESIKNVVYSLKDK